MLTPGWTRFARTSSYFEAHSRRVQARVQASSCKSVFPGCFWTRRLFVVAAIIPSLACNIIELKKYPVLCVYTSWGLLQKPMNFKREFSRPLASKMPKRYVLHAHARRRVRDANIARLLCESCRLKKKLENRVLSPTKLNSPTKLQKVIRAEKYDHCNDLSLVSVFTRNRLIS